MPASYFRTLFVLMALGCVGGCSTGDNPKMPDVPPQKITVDSTPPKNRGDGQSPYGASKKYQDMMNRDQQ